MADRLLDIPIKNITPNPHQPRTEFDEVALQELAASIREHGLIQPVAVTPNGSADHFTLLAGERRWRAAQMAGLEKIPAIVRERVDDQTRAEIALIENVQREGLSVVDEARAYEDLATRHQLIDKSSKHRTKIGVAIPIKKCGFKCSRAEMLLELIR